jgi:hypothetical protein
MQVHNQLPRFKTYSELRGFINATLCQCEHLVVGAFPMSERLLRRNGAPCGVLFSIHGPRSVVFNAVWDTDRNIVRFYTSTGERYQVTRLGFAPRLSSDMPSFA